MATRIVGGTAPSRDRRRNAASAKSAKDIILAGIRSGMTIRRACEAADRVESTYQYYRTHDPAFRDLADAALQARAEGFKPGEKPVPGFSEFCEQYLNTRLFNHHLQWYDLLEGREPRNLHPAQIYERREPDQILVNTPPEHAKSTTLTINYVTWRIVQDPNVRILIISKTQDMAKKFLVAIKDRLSENEAYAKLQADFGPPGGFAEGATRWAADAIYVNGRDSGEKDPTVQAQGIGGQIYGSRCDVAIMDDCVDHTNHHAYENQIDWIQNQVGSRVADAGGVMLLVGTRMNTTDLYSEIRRPHYYVDGESSWTYLSQPAVLEYADDPKDWVTLWPVTNRPPVTISGRKTAVAQGWPRDGLWPMWHGEALAKKRRKMRARNWSMVYQQEQVAEDSVFKQEDVQGCVDRARYPGRLMAGQSDHRQYGMEGMTVVAGLDPAAAGYTAMVVIALDRQTGQRWLLEVVNKRQLPPHQMRAEINRLTDRYRINEWRIEKNAYQASIVQDALIRDALHARGCIVSPHHTNGNKWDSDFGVASMASLFEGWREGRNLIRLPSQTQSEPIRNLIEQLCAWAPETKGLTDTVMALWFCEIRCRDLMSDGMGSWHSENHEFLSSRDRENQVVIDLEMALSAGDITTWNGSLNAGWGRLN